ncbi:MAG: putative rRNA maturation factor [Candidatus Curtissbacteria bacterium GW2011_GWA1_40_47]|nr:MAG: putative rRNA maturation factor [Candidatus Curtissbacteria bacterium GW2011_GWB1_40_28]KKR60785.1 MAG: putative rRNA maturation factor [Candidatus Curtissbacteria bacterium GW2011_GWA2_40_31]KKR61526.1 MAG: putative rRNA maturation factor [Microgenomates group bacterium GW2011_GWC1_40_35]KKR65434.1 MAG: putative rRNA maturation factor [Candidatus Curtissbacteria bacterium GW2011_GWA1_40_47]KKR77461.1 MAG: putative rRNA maturation factor [Candidatus Curtissbacteria bacterium GW2011_GWD1
MEFVYYSMVNVLIKTDTRYPVNRKIIRKAILDTFKRYKIEKIDAEVSVAVVGKRKMDSLCRKYLKDEKNHQVLAFALEEVVGSQMERAQAGFVNPPDEILRLGDVVLCWPQLLEEAAKDNIMVDEELYRLTLHGMEHLFGEHHE